MVKGHYDYAFSYYLRVQIQIQIQALEPDTAHSGTVLTTLTDRGGRHSTQRYPGAPGGTVPATLTDDVNCPTRLTEPGTKNTHADTPSSLNPCPMGMTRHQHTLPKLYNWTSHKKQPSPYAA